MNIKKKHKLQKCTNANVIVADITINDITGVLLSRGLSSRTADVPNVTIR